MAAEFIRGWQAEIFGGEMRNDLGHTAFLYLWMYVLCNREPVCDSISGPCSRVACFADSFCDGKDIRTG